MVVAPAVGAVITFLIALLVGGLAIYLSALFIVGVSDYSHAVFTALIGAFAWAITAWLVPAGIPLIGTLLPLVVWVGVINWRYPGGWVKAALVGLGAWIAALLILMVANSVFQLGIGAFGIPGV
jgi:hypothetical protein